MVQFSGSSIVSVIISVLILFVLIFNVVYIGGVRNALKGEKGKEIGLSKGAADFIFWLDIILIVMVFLYLVYVMFIIFTTTEERSELKKAVLRSQAGYGMNIRPGATEVYFPRQE